MFASIATTYAGKIIYTMIVSAVPVIELRAGIPIGVALGLDIKSAVVAAIIGNLIPVPFVLLLLRKIFNLLKKSPKIEPMILWLENRAHTKSESVQKYSWLGLCLLVAIPLPGTGAWTGALVASVLEMDPRRAIWPIALGVCIAAVIVTLVTYGVVALA